MPPPHSAAERADAHLGHLDGWRGLAIAALLVGHFLPVPGINFGTVGVNLFFVLSGLLMGGLLYEKKEPLSRFYRRRIARVFPAHLVFLLVMSVAWVVIGLPYSLRETLAALLFVNNYVPPQAGPGHALMPFGHIWSLSVEEHSYVLLSLVAIGARRRLLSPAGAVGTLLLASAASALYYAWLNPPLLAFDQWLHTEVAAYGLLATAWWVAAGRPMVRVPGGWVAAPALLAAGVCLHWWSVPLAVQRLLGVGCFAASLCVLSASRGRFAQVLAWRPLRELGLRSFSLYLWQQPFYLWMHADPRVPPLLALALAGVAGLASYRLVELPARTFLNARWGARGGRTSATP